MSHERASAELALVTMFDLDDDLLSLIAPAVVRAASDLAPAHVPAGLLADVVYLFLGPPARLDLANERASLRLPGEDALLKSSIVSVLDAFLAPIAVNAMLSLVRDALARHPDAVRVDTAGVIAAEVLGRVLAVAGAEPAAPSAPSVADVRRALKRPAQDLMSRGAAALAAPAVQGALATSYGVLARAARRKPTPLDRADVVVAECAPELRHRAARLALRQLAASQLAIEAALPAAIPRRRSRSADASTRLHDESTYPMGGFSSMTNVGSLENVVTSELALSSDGDIGEDLFAIRWATGELLYYMRDENVAHRRRVSIWITLAPELATLARVKDPDAPCQRIVLALSAVVAFTLRTIELLRREALTVHLVTPPNAGLDEERTLLGLRLADGVTRGVVEVREAPLDAVEEAAREEARSSDVLRLSVGATKAAPGVLLLAVAARPVLLNENGAVVTSPLEQSCIESWAEVVKQLLLSLP